MTDSRNSGRYLIAAALLLVFSLGSGGSDTAPSDIQVALSSLKPLSLRVTLRSRAETRVTFAKYRLPWGNRYSMVLIAVTPSGDYINRNFPVDDPSPERISLEPNEAMSGDVNLHRYFRGLDVALKKSDVHLFWAYKAPEEFHIPQWSGGWMLIPQQK